MKDCPFCSAGDLDLSLLYYPGTDMWAVSCENCKATGPAFPFKTPAILAWDTAPRRTRTEHGDDCP